MLSILKSRGIKLPERENDLSNLKVEDLIGKMRSFYERFDKMENADNEFLPLDFFELLTEYPVSMCSYNMSEQLKLVIALFYFYTKPDSPKEEDEYEGLSMDDLSIIFDRSKSSIHEAIRQKEAEAKAILEEAKLRTKAKEIALMQLVEEEKQKLKQNKQIEQTNIQNLT